MEPIAAIGEPYDPELMEAVEAVRGSGRPSGEVLDEVRRGYLYQGRVFRYAQVRVAKDFSVLPVQQDFAARRARPP